MSDDFEQLYKMWPNKGDKANTRLAYDFVYKKYELSGPDYLKAAELWIFKANDFLRKNQLLANWLRDEKFQPEIQEIASAGGISNALANAQLYRDVAHTVLHEWNRLRRPWWGKVEDFEANSYWCEQALRNEFFQKNWQRALAKAVQLFQYPERDAQGRQVVHPTISWFCDLKDFTVSKILEGEYGHVAKTEIQRYSRETWSDEDKREIESEFNKFWETTLDLKKQQTEGPWKVVMSFTKITMLYNNTTVRSEVLPRLKSDQNALHNTWLSQVETYNEMGYEPTTA